MALNFYRPGGSKYYAQSKCGRYRIAIFKKPSGELYIIYKKVNGVFQHIGKTDNIENAKKLCEE